MFRAPITDQPYCSMFSGFDYGTSNCAMGVLSDSQQHSSAQLPSIQLLPIDHGNPFMPSMLYSLERDLICEAVAKGITNKTQQDSYITKRGAGLARAQRTRQQADISPDEQALFFGRSAYNEYLELPEEGYFVKSPKSFLGASGLQAEYIQFFEDIVTAMMQHIKRQAERSLDSEITHTVIGRPVNFQGINAEESNQQALNILSTSAARAGFKSVEFLFEPLAAGLDFEQSLTKDQTVLVVDIGGGTTDCAMVRMGPSYRDKEERSQDFLGHSGERVGGNDLDIQLAGKYLMPLFGMQSLLKTGLPMPTQPYWDAVSTNDINAQTRFASAETNRELSSLLRDTTAPEALTRFIKLQESKQNHHVVRSAELAKIALSDEPITPVSLDYIERGLKESIDRHQFADAIQAPMGKMVSLMEEAIKQAGRQPDAIYITGGSAQSGVIRHAIQAKIGDIKVLDGNHFGSVASGLTVWAQRIFS